MATGSSLPSGASGSQITGAPRALWILLAGNGLIETGVQFFFPILPLFLRARGGGSLLVGAVVASGVLAKILLYYPAGSISDRFGRRPALLFSMGAYSLLSLTYLLPLPALAYIGLRFVHAGVAALYFPTAIAMVADLTPPAARGAAYGRLRATEMAGVLLGPVLGGTVAGLRLDAVFLGSALMCALATGLLVGLPRTVRRVSAGAAPPADPLALLRRLLPLVALGAPIYYAFGTYETVWALYLSRRGASTFQIGLSYAAYAAPALLLSALMGKLVDVVGHFRAAASALLTYGFLNIFYPLIANVWALIGIGVLEGALTSVGTPALTAEVSRRAPAGQQGRTQGLYETALTAANGLGAVTSGALYTIGPVPAFWGTAVACLIGVLAGAVMQRRPASIR
jgi:MFS family permease